MRTPPLRLPTRLPERCQNDVCRFLVLRLFAERVAACCRAAPQECTPDDFNAWKNNREHSATVESSRLSLVDYLEQSLQQRHKEYTEMASYKEELSRTFFGQVERMHVLNKAGEFFQFESSATRAYNEDARNRDARLLHEDDLEQGEGSRRV